MGGRGGGGGLECSGGTWEVKAAFAKKERIGTCKVVAHTYNPHLWEAEVEG